MKAARVLLQVGITSSALTLTSSHSLKGSSPLRSIHLLRGVSRATENRFQVYGFINSVCLPQRSPVFHLCKLSGSRNVAIRQTRSFQDNVGVRFISSMSNGMTPQEKYMFDLQGFLVVRGVLSKEEVEEANRAIDNNANQFRPRIDGPLRNAKVDTPLAGDGTTPRMDMGGMLGWPLPHSLVFRKLLAHPKLVPYINELCGEGYRLDHMPLVIASEKGAEGFSLHGGTINSDGNYVPYLAYHYSHGKMYNNLLACSVQLVDHPADSGGFIVIPGSHKANFPTPKEIINGEDGMGSIVFQPETKAGDVILFSEGTVHGAAPWKMPYQRRIALYRFAPPTVAYGRAYYPTWPESYYDGLTEEQRAVLEPAYNTRLDRPLVRPTADEQLKVEHEGRSQEKKNFDKTVFGTDYF